LKKLSRISLILNLCVGYFFFLSFLSFSFLFFVFLSFLSFMASLFALLALVEIQRIYDEQKATAAKIVEAFKSGSRQVLLNAMMQSGKTGAFLWAAFSLLVEARRIDNIVVICGSSENELNTQLKGDLDGYVKAFAHSFCDEFREYAGQEARISALILARTKILKSTDLKGATIPNKSLVIWDESHFAQSKDNLPYQFFERNGVKPTGTPFSDDLWAAKECFFLSVSATPFAQFSDLRNPEFPITAKIVEHVPGETYIGVKHYVDADRIRPSFSIEANPEEFEALLREYAGERKYALVRSHKHHEAIKQCCERAGVSYLDYNSDDKGIANLNALKSAPAGFTVIGLKGMCRMGKVVPKPHIAFVFEESQNSASDTVLQSLLGRMCGYGPYDLPLVFVSPAFLALKSHYREIDRYTAYVENGALMPARAAHLAKIRKVSGRPLLVPRKLVFHDDIEEYSEASRFREASREQQMDMIREKALASYIATPTDDAVQTVEVIEALRANSNISIHDYQSSSYGDIRLNLNKACDSNTRYDDPSWEDGCQFKAYFNDATVFFVGYTHTALDSTQIACKEPIAPTTGKEAFNPARDLEHAAVAHAAEMVNTDEEMDSILRTPGVHTVWIKRGLTNAAAAARDKSYRARGRNCPTKWKSIKSGYDKFVICISVIVTVTRTITIAIA
jgi:hypothetical protein